MAALVCYGLGDFIYKRATAAGAKPHHFLMQQGWCFFSAVLLYGWTTGALTIGPAAAWGALAGLFIFVGFYHFLRSLAVGSVSINAPIFRLNLVITAILAIALLHEPFKPAMLLALALAVAALWLLLADFNGGKAPEIDRASLGAVAIATLSVGAANFFLTMGLRQGGSPETILAAQAAVFTTLATMFVRLRDGAIDPLGKSWKYPAAAAVVLVAAFLLMLHGLMTGPASVLVPIAQMGFVVTAALGILVLEEPVSLRKIAGLGAVCAALAAPAVT